MADTIDHVFALYNDHEDIMRLYRLADNIFDDDITGRINEDTIIKQGTPYAVTDDCFFGNVTETTGTFRFVTDTDVNGNLHFKLNMYAANDTPVEQPAMTYYDFNMGDKSDVQWYGIAVKMEYKAITKVKVIYQRFSGSIVVSAHDSTLLSTMTTNFHYMHCVTGLNIDPDAALAINEYGGAFQFSIGVDTLPFQGYNFGGNYYYENLYPTLYKNSGTGVITDVTCVPSCSSSVAGSYQAALQNHALYSEYYKDTPFGHSMYLTTDDGALAKALDASKMSPWQNYGNITNVHFTLKGSGHIFDNNYRYGIRLFGIDSNSNQVLLAQTSFAHGSVFPNSSALGYVNGWLGLRHNAAFDTTGGIYKKICGEDPYTIFVIGAFNHWSDVLDSEGQSIQDSFFSSIVQNVAKLDSVGSTLWLVGHLETTDVDPEPPEEGKELEDEPIDPAENPTTSALDIGVIAIFNPTTQEMQDLTTEMQDVNVLDEITKYFKNSPLEGIMSCHVVPVDVTTSGKEAPHFGNVTFETEMNKVTEQYYTKNFGSIHVDKKFASFLDYAPYTRSEIYLPYIGYRQLDTDDIMDKDVGVIYNFDILTGAILAQVTVNGSVHYQYSGNAVMQFPLTASNHNHLITSIVGLVVGGVGVAAGAAAGGPVGVAAAVGMGASMVGNAIGAAGNAKPEIQHGGSFAMTNGFMSVKSPHLVMNRPVVDIPSNFDDIQGRMSNKTKLVSECEGYTEYFKVDVDNISRATDKEKELIENILLGGFYA